MGVNDGLPFTSNPCFRREFAWAQATGTPPAVYLNTSYSRRLLGLVTPACRRRAAGHAARAKARDAYALGCSEASFSLARTPAALAASVIWLDIETSNHWSQDSALNAALIQGMLDSLKGREPQAIVGLYSDRHQWQEITSGMTSPAAPEWTPQLGSAACTASFAGGPVWLSQGGDGNLDVDDACWETCGWRSGLAWVGRRATNATSAFLGDQPGGEEGWRRAVRESLPSVPSAHAAACAIGTGTRVREHGAGWWARQGPSSRPEAKRGGTSAGMGLLGWGGRANVSLDVGPSNERR